MRRSEDYTGTIPVVSMSSALRHSVCSQTLAQLLCDFAEHSTNWMGLCPSDTSLAGAHHDREPTVEELKRELAESPGREPTTAEVLKLRNFTSDLLSAFDAIAAKALDLCGALPVVSLRLMRS